MPDGRGPGEGVLIATSKLWMTRLVNGSSIFSLAGPALALLSRKFRDCVIVAVFKAQVQCVQELRVSVRFLRADCHRITETQ